MARTAATIGNNLGGLAATMRTVSTSSNTLNRSTATAAAQATTLGRAWTAAQAAFTGINTVVQTTGRVISAVVRPIQQIISIAMRLASVLGSALKSAFTAAGSAAMGFTRSASAAFAGLQRAVQGVQGIFRNFSSYIGNAFQQAQRHMRDFYNAGWSLLTSGRAFQNFGQNIFRGLTGTFKEYTDFEVQATRTAISASTDLKTIQELVFGMQSGSLTGSPLKQFNAKDLAEGLYFFTSAVGVDARGGEGGNLKQLATTVQSIMQLSAATQTSLETTTKGVLNAAMEFGIQPRDLKKGGKAASDVADDLSLISAQFGYLANATTMEVPDIAESFKMVGPLAHVLTGQQAGAGLNETFALIALASDVGLRGGNVGRGINQMFQTILDPTNPAIEAAAEAFGIGASKEAWDSFFLNSDKTLKGGITGLFKNLEQLDPSQVASMFTTNASRVIIGIQQAAKQFDDPKFGKGLEGMLKMMNDQTAAMAFLSDATAKSSNTIAASWQYLMNSIFAVKTSAIGAVRDNIIDALDKIAETIFKVAMFVERNEWVGKLVIGLTGFAAILATVVGSVMMFSGSMLLLAKAFNLLGAVAHPVLAFLGAFGSAFLTLAPPILALTSAALFFRRAWEENLMGIQDRVKGFTDTLREMFRTADTGIPNGAMRLFKAYEDASYAAGLAIIKWGQAHTQQLQRALGIIQQFVSGVVDGFTHTIAVITTLGMAFATLLRGTLIPYANEIANWIEQTTGLNTSFEKIAYTIGTVLGGSLAVLIAQHFVPAIVQTVALRGAMLALNVSMIALSVTAGLLSGVFSALTGIIGIITGVVSGTTLLGAVAVAALALFAGAFISAWLTVDDFGANVMKTLSLLWDGLQGPLVGALGIAVAAFEITKGRLVDFFETLAQHEEGLRTLGTLIGVTLVAAFGVFAAAAAAAIYIATQAIEGLVVWLDGQNGLQAYIDDLSGDLQTFFSAIQLGTFDPSVFVEAITIKIKALFAGAYVAILRETASFLTQLSDVTAKYTGLKTVFGLIGVDFDPDLAKALYGSEFTTGSIDQPAYDSVIGQAEGTYNALSRQYTQLIDQQKELNSQQEFWKSRPIAQMSADTGKPQNKKDWVEGIVGGKVEDVQAVVKQITDLFSQGLGDTPLIDEIMNKYSSAISGAGGGFTLSDILKNQYDEAQDAFTAYNKLVDQVGLKQAQAMYNANDMPIPTDPGPYEKWVQEQGDGVEQAYDELQKRIEEANKNVLSTITSLSIPDAMAKAFGAGSAGDYAGQVFETISKNLGDSAPWMNETEFYADLALSGQDLGKGLSGKNLQKELRPYLEVVAQQTGQSINDVMKDIPRYIAPEEFVPQATTDLIQGLSDIPKKVGLALDSGFGTDIISPITGQQAEETGIQWADLVQYGIGQAVANQDWNLADYISESWGISVDEANNYLKSHGIDPNVVTDEWFADTELLIAAQGGQVNLITEEWYNWAAQATDNFANKVITLTREQFDQLPDYVKLGLSGMGITFNIAATGVAQDINNSNKVIQEALMGTYDVIDNVTGQIADKGLTKKFWDRFFDDAAADGVINRIGMFVSDPFWQDGIEMITVWDEKTGVSITIPKIEYEEALQSARDASKINDELDKWRTRRDELKTELSKAIDLAQAVHIKLNVDYAVEQKLAPGAGGKGVGFIDDSTGQVVGNVKPAFFEQTYNVHVDIIQSELDDIRTKINTALGIGEEGTTTEIPADLKITVPPETVTNVTTAIMPAVQTAVQNGMKNVTLDSTVLDSQFAGIGTSAAAAFSAAFNNAMAVANLAKQGGSQSSDGQIYGDAGTTPQVGTSTAQTVTINFAADTTNFDRTFAAIKTDLGRYATTEYATDLTGEIGKLLGVIRETEGADLATWDSNEWATDLSGEIGKLIKTINEVETNDLATWDSNVWYTDLGADATSFYFTWQSAWKAGTAFDNANFTATLGGNNAPFMRAWQAAWDAGAAFEQKTFTATLSTVNTGGANQPAPYAAGGVVDEPLQVVGERGMELAALPQGTRVQSSARTMNMLQQAVTSALTPRDNTPVTSSAEFKQAAQWIADGVGNNQPTMQIHVDNINIDREVDIDSAYARFQRLMGRDNAMAIRGMIPTDNDRTL
jgi:TP901 family phage tail tape measure protein